MQSRTLARLARWLILLSIAATGCEEPLALSLKSSEPANVAIGENFDPRNVGTISGQVTWKGDVPNVKPFLGALHPGAEYADKSLKRRNNPHAPAIDAAGGVGDAVVFLRGVEPAAARPWDLPPVRVEMHQEQIRIHQGDAVSRAGFVKPGDAIEMVSREEWREVLQARRSAFFSLTLVDAGVVRTRRLDRLGEVELISGMGHFWMRGHIFVVAHPYYTRTDATGRFKLPQVPAGAYQLVCWHPNWRPASHERDGMTMLVTHISYQPAAEIVQRIRVERDTTATASIALCTADFEQ